jgi:hypothetical protein
VCVPNGPTIPLGASCQQVSFASGTVVGDHCEAGSVCAGWGTGMRCLKPCFLHTDCASGETCAASVTSSSTSKDSLGTQVPLAACGASDGCNPLEQTGCPDGTRCLFSPPDDVGRGTLCLPGTGERTQGQDCMSSTDCAPGVICGGLGFCLTLCYQNRPADAKSAGTCPPHYYCHPFFGSTEVFGRCE